MIRQRERRLATISLIAATAAFLVMAATEPSSRTFDQRMQLEESIQKAAGVSVGDVNGDGRRDIVFASGRHEPEYNTVLLSDGNGHFSRNRLDPVPYRSFGAVLADIDGDGDADIIISNDTPDGILTYKNDGKGRFVRAGSWGQPTWATRYLSIADVNGDGHPDIVVANAGAFLPLRISHPSFVCLNDTKGGFPGCRPLPTESAVLIPTADFDGDGAIDFLVPHRDGGQSSIIWADPTLVKAQSSEDLRTGGWMAGRTPYRNRTLLGPENMSCRAAAVGDFDGDGKPDVVLYDDQRKATLLFLNAGKRMFREPLTLPTGNRAPLSMSVADLNKDGSDDIVIGYNRGTRGSIFLNTQRGKTFTEFPWNDGKGDVYQIVVGDIDKDGWPDLIAARTGAPSGIWFNTPANR